MKTNDYEQQNISIETEEEEEFYVETHLSRNFRSVEDIEATELNIFRTLFVKTH